MGERSRPLLLWAEARRRRRPGGAWTFRLPPAGASRVSRPGRTSKLTPPCTLDPSDMFRHKARAGRNVVPAGQSRCPRSRALAGHTRGKRQASNLDDPDRPSFATSRVASPGSALPTAGLLARRATEANHCCSRTDPPGLATTRAALLEDALPLARRLHLLQSRRSKPLRSWAKAPGPCSHEGCSTRRHLAFGGMPRPRVQRNGGKPSLLLAQAAQDSSHEDCRSEAPCRWLGAPTRLEAREANLRYRSHQPSEPSDHKGRRTR